MIHKSKCSSIDIVIEMYNFTEYSDNYSKTSGRLWQYCKDISVVNNNGDIVEFSGANVTDSFNFKVKITGQTGVSGTKEVEITVPLKYLSSFWRTFEIFFITCEVNLILTWSGNCVTVYTDIANQYATLHWLKENIVFQ